VVLAKGSTPQYGRRLLRCRISTQLMTAVGSDSVIPVMSAARPLFARKRTSIRDIAMSHKCHSGLMQRNKRHLSR
jgi:hypothetical protein